MGPEWYTGSERHGYGVPLRYASYHKVYWYERTAYRNGTAPYQKVLVRTYGVPERYGAVPEWYAESEIQWYGVLL